MDTDANVLMNNVDKTENKSKTTTIYFGVHIPNDDNRGIPNVFQDKEAALKIAKKHKKSRFKAFQFYHEAVEFSCNGSEHPNNNSAIDCTDGEKNITTIGEKASPFRTPRPQELIEFRNKIEQGDLTSVQEMIEYNPKYLVSSGDTPSILQEGARLNALHVAAKEKNAAAVELILNIVSNPEFIKKLYGDDNEENAQQRCRILLDLYLNTPNKGANDTPLHIASKWGADKVVEVLLSYPECDKTKRNKFNKLAEEVICERVDGRTTESAKKKIQQLLCDNYYVPVLRSEDNSLAPLVGQPFSPTSPPVLNRDPLSPRLEIHAYAGPMDKKEAESFRKVWKTPPRSLNFNSPIGKKTPDNLSALRLKDPQKGLERIGKKLANNYNVSWREYWDFLDSFVDIASEEGLGTLEKHLKGKMKEYQDAFEVFSPLVQKIDDSPPVDPSQSCHPLLYVDKAFQVFANRVLANVFSITKSGECAYEAIAKNCESDVKFLESLMSSYIEDDRFTKWLNFQKAHSRLAQLVARKLTGDSAKDGNRPALVNKLESFLENIVKKSDYFSSDDEGPNCKDAIIKPTVYRKQVVCLWSRIKANLDSNQQHPDQEAGEPGGVLSNSAWDAYDVCNCVFHPKKPKRTNLSRNSSLKNHRPRKFDLQSVSKKLCFNDDLLSTNNLKGANGDLGLGLSDSSKSDTEEEFYTPPSSPTKFDSDSDSKEEFSDAEPPKIEVFLEGAHPSKTDCAVFNALQYAECSININQFPLVYKWYHSISLYSVSERDSWPNPHKQPSPPAEQHSPKSFLAHKPSWLRVTGTNSPKAAYKSYSPHH
ncbi:hypothetical protein GWI33_006251 [Rhynchophorus ferrugineus]|uniref:ANKLE2 third alpha/beta domain-containing protein n=1 Tax=Rhynchophorus ferrugineus TaxID=354439 RepID=A0A834IM83_RHYFE|nr:hypothetical protein GWI33_006251 [Rhynchophorus ferrugineus]